MTENQLMQTKLEINGKGRPVQVLTITNENKSQIEEHLAALQNSVSSLSNDQIKVMK
jgi:hypothetical protein